jgi:hypothetical protein
MSARRTPAILLAFTAFAFLLWGLLLIWSPGGSRILEWIQTGLAACLLVFAINSLRKEDPQRATLIRWLLTGFAVFGAMVVIGLTADETSSRTWVRLGWAALLAGTAASLIVWWAAPRVRRQSVIGGGVVALIIISAGVGITINCDLTVQRSWCDPTYDQEQALVEQVVVDGALQRAGRAGGSAGAALRSYLINGSQIVDVTNPPGEFAYEDRPIQSTETQRARFTAQSGGYSRCVIDVKLEEIPTGNLETVIVGCRSG